MSTTMPMRNHRGSARQPVLGIASVASVTALR
jgi:hypothetical protein